MGEKSRKLRKKFNPLALNYNGQFGVISLLIVAALVLLSKYDFKKGDEIIVPSLGEHKLCTIYSVWTKIKVCRC